MRPRLLDLFCCEGGAAVGYHRAGFDVVGVDRDGKFAKRYPFEFHQADAIEFVREHGHEFDAIHASPPCQAYSGTQKIQNNDHPDLIGPTRDALEATGVPYVIENVPGAPLLDPAATFMRCSGWRITTRAGMRRVTGVGRCCCGGRTAVLGSTRITGALGSLRAIGSSGSLCST